MQINIEKFYESQLNSAWVRSWVECRENFSATVDARLALAFARLQSREKHSIKSRERRLSAAFPRVKHAQIIHSAPAPIVYASCVLVIGRIFLLFKLSRRAMKQSDKSQ